MKVTIPKPCHENWATMTPDEKGRFCQVCSKSVRDFTNASDLQIIDNLSGDSNVCGNFRVDQLDRNLSHSFINSLFAKFAVGFVLTSGGIVSAQTQPKKHCEVKKETVTNRNIKGEVARIPAPKNDTLRMLGKFIQMPDTKEPLYILEGKIITEKKMKSLDQNTIERIDVLKGQSAMVIYGSKAKNGAVIITLKE
ncbi:hypothetical protein [Epilithonimonas sp. UC225_85]|uniref:hypothetical protein n=1 Tax=Epilithonimonas sp. UC225_85 TaxID=3350167 RepID=UPI0036D3762F